eukprot:6424158-Lingulodinium_polyedra.AAC.1
MMKDAIMEHFIKRGQREWGAFIDPVVEAGGIRYVLEHGLTTGLGCASTLANIFLGRRFNKWVVNALEARVYCRYMDDGGGIGRIKDVSAARKKLNGGRSSIHLKMKDFHVGRTMHLLDVNFKINEHMALEASTFSKPECIFDYLPVESSHHPAIYSA